MAAQRAKMNERKCPPCPPKPALKSRALMTPEQAGELEDLFKVLANDTRLRLLHAIAKHDEICVSDLAGSVEMKPQAVSNQLQRMSDMGIIASRREGNNIYYHVDDPCVLALLDQGLCLMEDAKREAK
jgi:DNA-binding transcriptional ArsR family regulator